MPLTSLSMLEHVAECLGDLLSPVDGVVEPL